MIRNTILISFIISICYLKAECSDLDSLECLQYSEYCAWNEDADICEETDGGEEEECSELDSLECLQYSEYCIWNDDADICQESDDEEEVGSTALEYAYLVEAELGPIPTFNCEDGVLIPIYQDGVEVFEDLPDFACDNQGLEGGCQPGSRIQRIEGTNPDGSPRPEVVWIAFCRRGDNFAQMIGHNTTTGQTTFLELNDGYLPTNDYLQPNVNVPIPTDDNYEAAWKAPNEVAMQGCNSCHNSDPFIHSRWVDGAKMPNNPTESVLPYIESSNSTYCIIGEEFQSWELKYIDIPNNACLSCHRLGNINAWDFVNNTDWNLYMPPYNPGSLSGDYDLIKEWIQDLGAFEIDQSWPDVPPCENLSVDISTVLNSFNLHQNYPNPFNPVTTLRYDLYEDSFVKITVYDMIGNVIKNLTSERQTAGCKTTRWNATNNQGQPVSAGVYLYKIQAGDYSQTKKMILLK